VKLGHSRQITLVLVAQQFSCLKRSHISFIIYSDIRSTNHPMYLSKSRYYCIMIAGSCVGRSCIVYRTKREQMAGLYREKRPYSAKPRITAEARSRVLVPRLGLLGRGAGEAHGGWRGQWGPQASGLMPESTSTAD
jgi:hypothetical protein